MGSNPHFLPVHIVKLGASLTLQFRRGDMNVGVLVDWDTYSELTILFHVQEAKLYQGSLLGHLSLGKPGAR